MELTGKAGQPRKRVLYTRCCDMVATIEQLDEMTGQGRQIGLATFRKHADVSALEAAFGYVTGRAKGLRLANDHYVQYFKSIFRGIPCYYLVHSAIEHIYLLPEQISALEQSA